MIGQFEKARDLHEDDDEGGFLRVSLGAHTSPFPPPTPPAEADLGLTQNQFR
jgi:hypothetical protein